MENAIGLKTTVTISEKPEKISLNTEQRERRPQILLVGNGLDMMFGAPSWEDLLWSIAKEMGSRVTLTALKSFSAPIQYESLSQLMVGNGRNELIDKIERTNADICNCYEAEIHDSKKELIQKILNLDLDAIVTTNYTHLFEKACSSSSIDYSNGTRHIVCKKLTTLEGARRKLYHLHGDIEIPQSIVLGHREYAECLTELENDMGHGRLTDLFMSADIYTLGHSLSGDEMDLWWLLSEKKRHMRSEDEVTLCHYLPSYLAGKELEEQLMRISDETERKDVKRRYVEESQLNDGKRWLITTLSGKNKSLGYWKKVTQKKNKKFSHTQNGKKYACDYVDFYRAIVDDIERSIRRSAYC